ncbi:aminotransferase [Aerococcus sp. 150760007-1]|uniref:Aminotransferase n=1 Tax=Aerococcus urinaeequi TaxID=51665 RepID=A0ABR5ZYS1_9LACT|nr:MULTISPECIES: aminotransferase class I/II-fold pyridoxal phosphate-dependent enzyme [Lactobacillales]KAF3300641.1 aminotransferase class I/II-fold pyridoxal phosphate-dependent enzyme [Carnobacterium sp. PL26RED25]KAF3305197.1 aminotransferase class I/II-fold pyridoxal phosphate-dependent enzyme [Carnobacterium sp. PL24RED07]MBA5746891.1 aminotransferase class I/II-fold pyridoxal phosphate-dependent enzyme [Aerococcus urinaeequi]MBA5829689.1 aminotransferase class I/II-fold pyridoxal phospha
MTINERLKQITPSEIRAFDAQVSTIPGLLNFTIGEPNFDVPEFIKDAMKEALDKNFTHYAASDGLQELRQAIANFYQRRHQLDLNWQQIMVTVGASQGFMITMMALLNPGDKVLIPSPYFPLYGYSSILSGGDSVFVDTSADGFVLTPEALDHQLQGHPEIKLLMLNYPNNPTGTTYSKDQVKGLAEVLRKYPDVYVLSDEIYGDLVYEGDHYSMVQELPERTILLAGASKSYAMTGFRLGFLHIPADLYEELFKIFQTMVTCVSTPDQWAGVAAYNDGDQAIDDMKGEYNDRRKMIVDRMTAMGFDIPHPAGAFYVFPRIPAKYGDDDQAFALDLAEKAKVGVIPGSAFGPGGQGYFRFSYAAAYEDIAVAMDRIAAFMEVL